MSGKTLAETHVSSEPRAFYGKLDRSDRTFLLADLLGQDAARHSPFPWAALSRFFLVLPSLIRLARFTPPLQLSAIFSQIFPSFPPLLLPKRFNWLTHWRLTRALSHTPGICPLSAHWNAEVFSLPFSGYCPQKLFQL